MKKLFYLICCVLFSITCYAREEILNYDSVLDIQQDGSVIITETLTVHHEGKQIRRGIYRDLPITNGERYELISVKRNGQYEPSFVEHPRDYFRINTGDDSLLPPNATSQFEIKYKVFNVLRKFDGYDEFYWNITGNKWIFPIRQAHAKVLVPNGVKILQQKSFTGRKGATKKATELALGEFTTNNLTLSKGMTIVIGFTPNVVNVTRVGNLSSSRLLNDPKESLFSFDLTDEQLLFFAVGILIAYLLIVKVLFCRKPSVGRLNAQPFAEPTNLTPCEVAALYGRNDLFFIHLTSMVKSKAITIEKTASKKLFSRDKWLITTLDKKDRTQEEQRWADAFDQVVIDGTYNAKLAQYGQKFTKDVKQKIQEKYINKHTVFIVGGVALALLLAAYGIARQASFTFEPYFWIGFVYLAFKIGYAIFPTPNEQGAQKIAEINALKENINTLKEKPFALNPELVNGLYVFAFIFGLEKIFESNFQQSLDGALHAFVNDKHFRHTYHWSARNPSSTSSRSGFSSGSSGGGFGGGGGGGR